MADQELVVKFKADLAEWDAAIAKAKTDLSLLDGYLRKAAQAQAISSRAKSTDTTATTQLIAAMNSLGRKLAENTTLLKDNSAELKNNSTGLTQNTTALKNFKPAAESATNSISGFLKGYISITALMEGGRMFLDATAKMQKYEGQLKAASGTQENFSKNTAFLEGLADRYNKNVIDLGASYAQLTIATKGTNLEGEKADRLFAAVTATSSALKMSVDDTNGTFRAFIQMVSKGNVQAEELRGQLGERLYGAFNLAAKAMGVTTSELNKMLENGDVLADDLLPKLTIELEKSFGEDAQKNAHNLGSEIEYVAGQITLLVGEAGKSSGLTTFLTDLASAAGELVKEIRNANKEFGTLGAFQYSAQKGATGYVNLLIAGLEKATNLLPYIEVSLGRISGPEGKLSGFNEYVKNQGMTPSMPNFPLSGEVMGSKYYIGPGAKASQDSSPVNEKAKKAAEKAAKEAERELKKWTDEQIWQIKNDAAQRIADIDFANQRSQLKFNSWIPAQRSINAPGIKNTYSTNGGQMSKTGIEFVKPVTGDGSAQNYDHIIAGMDGAIEKIKQRYKNIQEATDDFNIMLTEGIRAGLGNAIQSTAEGLGELGAKLAMGTADWADVGDTFLSIIATLFKQIGDALSAYAATMIVAKIAIDSMNVAGALVGAALAYGASALARSQMQSSSSNAFWTGGIVDGPGGRDNVPAMLTAGEMVINGSQQSRLWGILSGANSSRDLPTIGGGNAHGGELTINLQGRLKRGDIDMSSRQGARDNAYFSV